jgi:hypothetical protein
MSSSKRAYGWKCSKSTRSRRIRKQSSTSMAQGLIPLCASFERLWSACQGAVGRAERQWLGRLCRSLAGLGEYRHLEDESGPCGPGGDLDATAQARPRSATRVRKSFATSRAVFALEVARWRSASCPHVGQFSQPWQDIEESKEHIVTHPVGDCLGRTTVRQARRSVYLDGSCSSPEVVYFDAKVCVKNALAGRHICVHVLPHGGFRRSVTRVCE